MSFFICLWYVVCIVGTLFYFIEAGIAFRLNNIQRIYTSLLICFIFVFLGFIPKINEIATTTQLQYTREQLSNVKSKEEFDIAFQNVVNCKKEKSCAIGLTSSTRVKIFNSVVSQYDLGKYKQ